MLANVLRLEDRGGAFPRRGVSSLGYGGREYEEDPASFENTILLLLLLL